MTTFRIDDGYAIGNFYVSGTLEAQSMIVSSSQILTSGSTIFGDSSDDTHQFTGSVYVSDAIQVAGNTTLLGDLAVSGSFSVGTLSTTNIVNSNDLYVLNDAFVSGTTTSEDMTISKNLDVSNDLYVTNGAYVSGTFITDDSSTLGGATTINGLVSATQDMEVTGTLTITDILSSSMGEILNDFYVLGDSYVSGTLTATSGGFTNLNVNDDFSVGDDLYVIGDSYISGSLRVEGDQHILKGYSENGTFSIGQLATGIDSIAQGQAATASGDYSVVGGGDTNVSSAAHAVVAGGFDNIASGASSSICGGESNRAIGNRGVVVGGMSNTVDTSAQGGVVVGGLSNTVEDDYSIVNGGYNNSITGKYSTVNGGSTNNITNNYSTVAGGLSNASTGRFAVILGSSGSNVSGEASFAIGTDLDVGTPRTIVIGGGFNGAGDLIPYDVVFSSSNVRVGDLTAPISVGADTTFFVSGTIAGKGVAGVAEFGGDVVVSGAHYSYISSSGPSAKYPVYFEPGTYVPMASVEAGANVINVWNDADLLATPPVTKVNWTTAELAAQSGSVVWQRPMPPLPTPSADFDLVYDYFYDDFAGGNVQIIWNFGNDAGTTDTFTHNFESEISALWQEKSTTISGIVVNPHDKLYVSADLFASGSATGSIANVRVIL